MGRIGLSKRTRFEIFKRDQFTCQYCGRRPPDVLLQVDHIIAVANGGTSEPDNLTTSCGDCNAGKGAVPLGAVQPAVDEQARLEGMQEMAERANLLNQEREFALAQREADERAIETVKQWWQEIGGTVDSFQASSVSRFLRRLYFHDLYDAMQATGLKWDRHPFASGAGMWRYFCGVCWAKIREAPDA